MGQTLDNQIMQIRAAAELANVQLRLEKLLNDSKLSLGAISNSDAAPPAKKPSKPLA